MLLGVGTRDSIGKRWQTGTMFLLADLWENISNMEELLSSQSLTNLCWLTDKKKTIVSYFECGELEYYAQIGVKHSD